MAMHTPGKSDAGSMGSTVGKQNPIKSGPLRQPKTAGKFLKDATRNFNPKSPPATGSNKFRKNG
jgi:hypothetical protein